MTLNRCAVVLPLLVLLAGCFGSKLTGKEPAELDEFKPGATWKCAGSAKWAEVGSAGLQPAVTRDAVYVANAEGELFRLDPVNGKKVWKIE